MSEEMDPSLDSLFSSCPTGTLDGLPSSADRAEMSQADIQTILNAAQVYQDFTTPFFDPDPFPIASTSSLQQPCYPKRAFPGELADDEDDDLDLADDPETLKREVKRLRRELRQERRRNDTASSAGSLDPSTPGWGGSELDFGGGGGSSWSGGTPSTSTGSPFPGATYEPEEHLEKMDPDRMGGASGLEGVVKRKGSAKVNLATGKIQASGRKVALNKAIRDKMRQLMGITNKDLLPNPDELAFDANGIPLSRPKWKESVRKPYNKAFIEQVVTSVINEAWTTIRAAPELELAPCPIPEEDLDKEVALKAAKTSLTNFGKRWHAENDAAKVGDLDRDTKRRRRWARKDLKHKQRAKAASDPSCSHSSSQDVLRIDYMSSEYSSEGEKDDSPSKLAPGMWDLVSGRSFMGGIEEKVLEVRTPRWRSQQLNDIYTDLDTIAARQTAAAQERAKQKPRPSHRRFRLNPLRDLPPPEAAVRLWEYDPFWLEAEGSLNAQARIRTGLVGAARTVAEYAEAVAGPGDGRGEGWFGEVVAWPPPPRLVLQDKGEEQLVEEEEEEDEEEKEEEGDLFGDAEAGLDGS